MAALKIAKTYVAKSVDVTPAWHLFDAQDEPLGRMASKLAILLQGKTRSTYTANVHNGDYVVVTNAARVRLTGKKYEQKEYNFHSGFPGGFRTLTVKQMLARNPARIIELAVRGMLPKTTLGRQMLKRLKVYSGPNHPHEAQLKGYGVGASKHVSLGSESEGES